MKAKVGVPGGGASRGRRGKFDVGTAEATRQRSREYYERARERREQNGVKEDEKPPKT